jgi:hypothetical protein
MGDGITLTAPQAEQLTAFLDEKDHEGSVLLRKAKHLGALEAVLLDDDGNETNAKRLLFGMLRTPSGEEIAFTRSNREVPLMSIAVRITPSNMTRQQYDSVRNALTASGDWPADGCQLHVLFGDENDLRVSEVWESREKFETFGEKLGPRIEDAGIQMSGEPEVFEAHMVETF